MSENVAVIICAAGASSRFGGKKKKQFADVAGRAAFLHSVELFTDRTDVKQVLLAIAPEDEELVSVKWGPNLNFFGVRTYFGGEERFDTVTKGLELLKDDIGLVAVHDAVRPCITKKWVDQVIAAAAESGAAILACPVVATIKQVEQAAIIRTVDRTGLYEAQTPQVFKTELLKKAYENIEKLDKDKISDDAQLIEYLGEKVSIVETESSNMKITQGSDIPIADAILKGRPKPGRKGPIGPYEEAQW